MSTPSEEARVARLVTFLGTGHYQDTICEFETRQARPTRYVCRALADLLQPSDIAVLATEEAEQTHGAALQEALRTGNCPAPLFVRIPFGRNSSERWKQFELLKDQLRDCSGPIMLDVTHGFRSQPLFAASIVAFVRAVDDAPSQLRVCYAAFEAREANVTPIWEITEFVTLLDWAQALRMFLRTGRAQEAAEETERLGRGLAKTWVDSGKRGERPTLDKLGAALRVFGADFETLRTGDLLIGRGGTKSSAKRLMETVQFAKQHAAEHAPPLGDILERVAAMAEPLASLGKDLSGEAGRKAITALADLYLRLGRYLEAAATVREGWVNFHAAKLALVPASSGFDMRERKQAENRAYEQDPTYQEVTDRRDDLLHAQYRPSAQKADDMIGTVKCLVEKLRIASETRRGACFVNLSNHPSAGWDDAQTKAAGALAERIEDVAFPDVPPNADEKAIEALAENCIARIPPETSHALVQGEFTLTVALVRRLQERRITCLAATSARQVEEDAEGRRTSSFTFVRFRAYPLI